MTQGTLRKMRTELVDPVHYQLPVGETLIDLNSLLGQEISLVYSGRIFCIECARKTNKSFNQGYCFPCLRRLAACDTCIVRPELCHYHEGTCREPQWGEAYCMQPHVVYLANSSGLKVGITRQTQVPTRWIDQGAIQALPIVEVDTRLQSGLIETALKSTVNDKTDWRRMLKGGQTEIDLKLEWEQLRISSEALLTDCQSQFGASTVRLKEHEEPTRICYPVLHYPEKVKAFNFDKEKSVKGTLEGIKGQYLILDQGVLNIRKFAGYEISFTVF
jgi:hypothetical protein